MKPLSKDYWVEDRKLMGKFFFWGSMIVISSVGYMIAVFLLALFGDGVGAILAGVLFGVSTLVLVFGTIRQTVLGFKLWGRMK